jgi:lipopolysaccharide/colanic/teichoic acid biosynthesis glycosyltransferase
MNLIYKSLRVGKGERLFYLYKFRSMVRGADKLGPQSTAGDDKRITKVGRFIRKYKIDELPQIWNVIKRDINIVGPRPEVPSVVAKMAKYEKDIIFSVRPGLVDLATLNNFHEEDRLAEKKNPHEFYMRYIWPEKKYLQMEYIKTRSIWLDIKIVLICLRKLIFRR